MTTQHPKQKSLWLLAAATLTAPVQAAQYTTSGTFDDGGTFSVVVEFEASALSDGFVTMSEMTTLLVQTTDGSSSIGAATYDINDPTHLPFFPNTAGLAFATPASIGDPVIGDTDFGFGYLSFQAGSNGNGQIIQIGDSESFEGSPDPSQTRRGTTEAPVWTYVPEPSSAAALLILAAGTLARRRRG